MQWTLRALVGAAGVEAEVRGDAEVTGLAYDPSTTGRGDLFCCIPGARADGHAFAGAVTAAGAAALLVERWLDVQAPQAKVDRVRDAMGSLAAAYHGHPSRDLTVAAVTGTNGKTTVTYLVESIGETAGLETGVIGTVTRRYKGSSEKAARNTPEAIDLQALLARMRDVDVRLVALEATSDGLAQGRLLATEMATAGFTNLTQDHLNTHGSMEAYFEAKAMLFREDYTSRAVINVADVHGRRLAGSVGPGIDVLTYGTDDADIRCESADLRISGTNARVRTPSGVLDLETSLVGRYNIENSLCAIGMALHLGIGPDVIVEGVKRLHNVAGRLESVDAGQSFLALVDYAHTPDALEQALRACRELTPGKLIVVFGCGGDRDSGKRPLMGEAATRYADLSVITSDNPRTEDPSRIIEDIEVGAARGTGRYTIIPDRREAIRTALGEANRGDVVVVAGKGHEQGQELGDRTIPFDDREVVRELLGELACRS